MARLPFLSSIWLLGSLLLVLLVLATSVGKKPLQARRQVYVRNVLR